MKKVSGMRKEIIATPFLTYFGIFGLIYGFLLMGAMQSPFVFMNSILIVVTGSLSLALAIALLLNLENPMKITLSLAVICFFVAISILSLLDLSTIERTIRNLNSGQIVILNTYFFYGFWIALLATVLMILFTISEKVKLPKTDKTSKEIKELKRGLSSFDFTVFKLISEGATTIEKIQEKIPSVSMQAIQSSIDLLLEKDYIVLENGEYKLTILGFEFFRRLEGKEKWEVKDGKKEIVKPTLITKILNTMALFLFTAFLIFPLASLGGFGVNSVYLFELLGKLNYLTFIIYFLLVSIFIFSIYAHYRPGYALVSGVLGIILAFILNYYLLANLTLDLFVAKVKPNYEIGFYLLILASFLWLISYFTAKRINQTEGANT